MASPGVPLSVEEIVQQANQFEYNPQIPLRYWLRTADTLQKEVGFVHLDTIRPLTPLQAQVYEAEGDDQQTYLLLFRHAQLVLQNLLKHPERSVPANKRGLAAASHAVQNDLVKLETIKPRLQKRRMDYLERRRAQQSALESLEDGRASWPRNPDAPPSLNQGLARRLSYEKATLDAGANRLLAAKLAQREVRRRDAARRSVRQAGVSEEQEAERRTGGVWGDWEEDLHRESDEADDDLSQQIQEVARLQNGKQAPAFSVIIYLAALG